MVTAKDVSKRIIRCTKMKLGSSLHTARFGHRDPVTGEVRAMEVWTALIDDQTDIQDDITESEEYTQQAYEMRAVMDAIVTWCNAIATIKDETKSTTTVEMMELITEAVEDTYANGIKVKYTSVRKVI